MCHALTSVFIEISQILCHVQRRHFLTGILGDPSGTCLFIMCISEFTLDANGELLRAIQGKLGLTMAVLSQVTVLLLCKSFEDCVPDDESNTDTKDEV